MGSGVSRHSMRAGDTMGSAFFTFTVIMAFTTLLPNPMHTQSDYGLLLELKDGHLECVIQYASSRCQRLRTHLHTNAHDDQDSPETLEESQEELSVSSETLVCSSSLAPVQISPHNPTLRYLRKRRSTASARETVADRASRSSCTASRASPFRNLLQLLASCIGPTLLALSAISTHEPCGAFSRRWLAPRSSSRRTTAVCPPAAAWSSALNPSESQAAMSAPLSRRRPTALSRPSPAAHNSAVLPALVRHSMSTPRVIRN